MRLGRIGMVSASALLACGVAVLGMRACIVPAPSDERGGERQRTVGQRQPAVARIGADLGDKVTLLGAQLLPGQLIPGEPMAVALYFQVIAPLEDDYSVFVHVDDAATGVQLANVDHVPSSGATSGWRVGETKTDQFQVMLPAGASPQKVNLWVGLWNPKTDARMPVKNATQVRNDGRDRILIGPIPTGRL